MGKRTGRAVFFCRFLVKEVRTTDCADHHRFAHYGAEEPDELGLTPRHSPCYLCPVGLRVRGLIKKGKEHGLSPPLRSLRKKRSESGINRDKLPTESSLIPSVPSAEPANGTHPIGLREIPFEDTPPAARPVYFVKERIHSEDSFHCKWLDKMLTFGDCIGSHRDATALRIRHSPCYRCIQGSRHRDAYARS